VTFCQIYQIVYENQVGGKKNMQQLQNGQTSQTFKDYLL